MSFVRRFQSWPGTENLALIEGVAIIDTPAPGNITGVNSGIAAMIGEFPDCSSILAVDNTGTVSAAYRAVEVRGSQVLAALFGGFDSTLGNFGSQCGNGFAELRNKVFAGGRIVIVPINIASTKASRFWRELPPNRNNSTPAPFPPMQPAIVAAGRSFTSVTPYTLNICKQISFASTAAYAYATNGVLANVGSNATTGTFTRASGSFLTNNVKIGDIIVIGDVATPAASTDARGGTYRILSVYATTLTVERLDGGLFDWHAGTSLAWRVHGYACADTGNTALSDSAGYNVPVRTLSHAIVAASALAPVLVPAVGSTLVGLSGKTHPDDSTTYDAAIQSENVITSGSDTLMAEYQKAFDCLLAEEVPANLPSLLWSARKFSEISAMGQAHVTQAASQGHGRMWFGSPPLDSITSLSDVITGADGVSTYPSRAERRVYPWPAVQTLVPEAMGTGIAGSDGNTYSDGVIDTGFDGWEVAVASNLNPERSIGEEIAPATDVLAPVIGFSRGALKLTMDDYISLKQLGVSAPFQDKVIGMVVQSAVTTSLTVGETQINRRRMADYIEDSLAVLLKPFSKRLLTESLKDVIFATVVSFLSGLKKPANPDDQRIEDYAVDADSLNTAALSQAGIYALGIRVETLATADVIALQCSVGKGVLTITAGA